MRGLRTRKWQDKEGQDRYTTEIVGNEMQMLDSRGVSDNSDTGSRNTNPAINVGESDNKSTESVVSDDWDDDIPFLTFWIMLYSKENFFEAITFLFSLIAGILKVIAAA